MKKSSWMRGQSTMKGFPMNRKVVLAVAGYGLLGYVCMAWVGHSRNAYQGRLEELQQLDRAKAHMSVVLDRAGEIRESNQGLDRMAAGYQRYFAAKDARTSVLSALNALATRAGTRIRAIVPQAEGGTSNLREWGLRLNVEGTYSDIVDYVSEIEHADALMAVRGIEIRKNAKNENLLDVEIWVTAYLREGARP